MTDAQFLEASAFLRDVQTQTTKLLSRRPTAARWSSCRRSNSRRAGLPRNRTAWVKERGGVYLQPGSPYWMIRYFTEVAPRVWVAHYDWMHDNITLVGGSDGNAAITAMPISICAETRMPVRIAGQAIRSSTRVSTPRRSLTICANAVSLPWPIEIFSAA